MTHKLHHLFFIFRRIVSPNPPSNYKRAVVTSFKYRSKHCFYTKFYLHIDYNLILSKLYNTKSDQNMHQNA